MAPRIEQDYHSRGDSVRYALRALKQKECNQLEPRDTDLSGISKKEVFFLRLGLHMKRHRNEILNKDPIKSTDVPSGMLRECSVIILGVKCRLCFKCFKCETDLNVHYKLIHGICVEPGEEIGNEQETNENEVDGCNQATRCLTPEKHDTGKSAEVSPQKKLRVIFKIGDEVVARKSVKRKHFKSQATGAFARREGTGEENELIAGDDSFTDPIDFPRCCDSPCQCCDSCIYAAKSRNRYSVSDNVETKPVLREESVAEEGNDVSTGAKESREVSCTHKDCSTICYFPEQTGLIGRSSTAGSSKASNDVPIPHGSFMTFNPKDNNSFKSLNCDTKVPSNQTAFANSNDERTIPINENINVESNNMSNVVIVPVILPVKVSDKNSQGTTIGLMIQSTPVYLHFPPNQQNVESQYEQHREEELQKQVPKQQEEEEEEPQVQRKREEELRRTSSTEENSGDIEEVLIIGGKQTTEFNQESPNRLQRKQLLYATTEKTMQVSPPRTKKNESMKRKIDMVDQCSEEKNQRTVTNSDEEKLLSTGYSGTVKTRAPNEEENSRCKNIDASTELHGVNYCEEEYEINNNSNCIHAPLSRSSVSAWQGESKETKKIPILIDLDSDE